MVEKKKEIKSKGPELFSMFPTFVWKIQLELEAYGRINTTAVKTLGELMKSDRKGPEGEVWQSHQGLHQLKEFEELVACVLNSSTSILKFLKIGHEKIEFTGCWANVNPPGHGHRKHSHPNNFLSGVYYIQTHEKADTISFHEPRIQNTIIRPPVTELTNANTDQVVVTVGDGTLLLFPSWLEHSVSPNGGQKNRMSISFNLMFSRFEETISRPLW